MGRLPESVYDVISEKTYGEGRRYTNSSYLDPGLHFREDLAVRTWFPPACPVLVAAAGGGRELIALEPSGFQAARLDWAPRSLPRGWRGNLRPHRGMERVLLHLAARQAPRVFERSAQPVAARITCPGLNRHPPARVLAWIAYCQRRPHRYISRPRLRGARFIPWKAEASFHAPATGTGVARGRVRNLTGCFGGPEGIRTLDLFHAI